MSEGILSEIGLWPQQWATARMFAGSAKGFHVHPPHIPAGEDAQEWLQKLYGGAGFNERRDLRPYALEQWDVMFFVQGMLEVLARR